MTIKTTIEVSDDYLVKARDHFSFFNQTAFELTQTDAGVTPSLTNAGVINVVCDNGGALTGLVTGGSDIHEASSFWNQAGGHFYVSGEQSYQLGGIFLGYDHNRVRNDGEMVIRGGEGTEASGIVAGGEAKIVNNGALTVMGGRATGIDAYEAADIDNSGTILAQGHDSTGVSFAGAESKLHNSSLILVRGDWGSAVAVQVDSFGDGSSSITNDGRIIAEAANGIGVSWSASDGHSDELINTGLIQATVALSERGASDQTILNSGVIRGLIELGLGEDHLTNTGRLVGDIDLGNGDDTLDGNGQVSGVIWGGGGSDLVVGGAQANVIHGDDPDHTGSFGEDTLIGGGGADSLFGGDYDDRLVGGKGADVLTGGGGHDVFAFTSMVDSTVKHADLITDLANGDKIDLSAIDANPFVAGDQSFFLVANFDGHMGEARLSYDAVDDVTRLELDVDGDRRADGAILISGDWRDFDGFVR